MKTFAEILKENIDKRFIYTLKPRRLTPFQKEIKQFFVNENDLEEIHGSRLFYSKLFKYPVKSVFYWCEEDWQGSIFVIYKYHWSGVDYFICCNGSFGSCEISDGYLNDNKSLDYIFNNLKIVNKIDDITFSDFNHPNLKIAFDNFKLKVNEEQDQVKVKIDIEPALEVVLKVKTESDCKDEVNVFEIKSWVDVVNKK